MTKDFTILKIDKEALILAQEYVKTEAIPKLYIEDALHIAIATVNDLVSWNFEHIVKRRTRIAVNGINLTKGYRTIDIVAPTEI